MPFIGNKPSAVPLTSADITDGIITSAKIVDGTIVNADINASAGVVFTKLASTGTLTVDNIQFPATQVASANANNLDDYEEGTWTPTLAVGSGTINSQSNTGEYTKIGRLVIVTFRITANTTSASSASITGLPFTSGFYSSSSIAREWSQTGQFWGFTLYPSSTSLLVFRYDNNGTLPTGAVEWFASVAYKI